MYAIMDIEGIQISKEHICVRQMYILCQNGISYFQDFVACNSYNELDLKYQGSFNYCKKYVHHLEYNPRFIFSPDTCQSAQNKLEEFIQANNISIIFYKGGTIEKGLCASVGIHSYDIGDIVPKAFIHNPICEVHSYFNYLNQHYTSIYIDNIITNNIREK